MESVGPVDIGDERALPDLSRDEQGEVTEPTLSSAVVKQRLFALSTGCGTALQAVHKSGWGMRVAGRKSALPPGPSGAHDVWGCLSDVVYGADPAGADEWARANDSSAPLHLPSSEECCRLREGRPRRPMAPLPQKVVYFLHLFAGAHRRRELGSFLQDHARSKGLYLVVINWDLARGPEFDLRVPTNVRRLVDLLLSGLFAGAPGRRELGSFLQDHARSKGLHLVIINWDLMRGPEFDLRVPANARRLVDLLMSGLFAGVHAGPPCSTW